MDAERDAEADRRHREDVAACPRWAVAARHRQARAAPGGRLMMIEGPDGRLLRQIGRCPFCGERLRRPHGGLTVAGERHRRVVEREGLSAPI